MSTSIRICCLIAVLVLASQVVGAELPVQFLFPAGAQVEVWASDDRLQVTSAEKKGELVAKVAADLSPGVYWLRLHDGAKASKILPFVVSGIPEIREEEPNDALAEAKELTLPVVVNGQLSKAREIDCSRIQLKTGQTLIVSVRANSILKSPMDAVLQLCDEAGFVVAQQDDEKGLDPQLVFSPSADGVFHIRLFAFPEQPNSTVQFSGAETYVYRMTVTVGPFIDYVMPLALSSTVDSRVQLHGWNLEQTEVSVLSKERNWLSIGASGMAGDFSVPVADTASAILGTHDGKPIELTIPSDFSGTIRSNNIEHLFTFEAKKSQKLDIRVQSQTLGFALDPVLTIYADDGTKLKELDDAGKQRDPELTWTVPNDGRYRLGVKDLFGDAGFRFAYRLTISEAVPDFQVSLKADVFDFGDADTLKIPLTVQRLAKFDQAITVECGELPEGVEMKPVLIESKSGANMEIELVLERKNKEDSLSVPLRLWGRSTDGRSHQVEFGKRTDRGPHTFLWLLAKPKKE
jgi:hypothetical protein